MTPKQAAPMAAFTVPTMATAVTAQRQPTGDTAASTPTAADLRTGMRDFHRAAQRVIVGSIMASC